MSGQERRELNNALASTRMEGFTVTEQTELDVSVYSAAKSLLRIWSGRY